jgi:hypothetical protein
MKHGAKEVDYKVLRVTSSAFGENEMIPVKYTCDGINVSPPLDIDHIPAEAISLAIIVDDPDAPMGTWVHWVVWNVPVTHHLKENEIHGMQGMNDFSRHVYRGPCQPSGTHRYSFKVYALDDKLDLPVSSTKYYLEKAMGDHILAFGELVGLYKRQ